MRMSMFLPYPKPKTADELDANRRTYLVTAGRDYDKKPVGEHGAAYFSEYEVAGVLRYGMVVFLGKSSKPYENVYYRKPENRQAAYDRYVDGAKRSEAYKAERKEAQKPSNEGVKVGDIFVGSGGYDQTNVEALQVVELVGKSQVKVRPVFFEDVPGSQGFMSSNVKPVKDKFADVPADESDSAKNRADYYRGRGGLRQVRGGSIKSTWGSASKWDGHRSYYSSSYA